MLCEIVRECEYAFDGASCTEDIADGGRLSSVISFTMRVRFPNA